MRLKLEKYHGLGNDYLVFDPECNRLELTPQRVKLLCNRNVGVGADGILEGPVFKEGKIHRSSGIRMEARRKTVETVSVFSQNT